MSSNENIKSCGFADEIVSYIYGEILEPERTRFEDHFVDCSSCTDEFAGISTARLAMFEYHKEAFAPLATPEIVIPYAEKRSIPRNPGFFDGVADLWSKPAWSSAFAFAGVVTICIGLGFAAINYVGRDQQAANKTVSVQASIAPASNGVQTDINLAHNDRAYSQTGESEVTKFSKKAPNNPIGRPVLASIKNGRRIYSRNLTANVDVPENVKVETSVKQKAPVLSTYDDDDDKSLRLADLLDDGGV